MNRTIQQLRLAILGILLVTLSASSTFGQTAAVAKSHTRYKVVFTPTFGGTDNHIFLGAHVLNNAGTLIGSADTAQSDPYAPDGCFNDGDCLVAHAFAFHRGQSADLGSIPGGANSETTWISPNGLISGNSQNGMVDPVTGGWEMHGVLWKHGQLTDLGTLDGGPLSITSAVNSSGEVVGLSLTTTQDPYSMAFGFYQTRAYLWKNGVMQDLGTLGGPDAMAVRINESGQIVGNSYTSFTPGACGLTTGAFLWQEGKMTDLGNFGGTCATVNDLNNRGQVVGSSLLPGDQLQHPFLWDRGKLIDLGTLGGDFGVALAINDSAAAVGFAGTAENRENFQFHAALWTDGKITDLEALGPDQCSLASSVNAHGQAVGLSGDCFSDELTLRAFISENEGPVVDLNSLIPPNSGVQLRNAVFINDRGEIAAIGAFPDGTHGPVLLVPCGNSETAIATCQNVGQNLHTQLNAQSATVSSASSTGSWPRFPWVGANPLAQFAHSRFKRDAPQPLQ